MRINMKKEQLLKLWQEWSEEQDSFQLNPHTEMVEGLAQAVLNNEEKAGYKFCPCRVRDGTHEQDIKLLCPCNFKTHDTWLKEGRCWCGLFVKKE